MDVSVIIPTYNGAERIGVTLDALKKQKFKDFELVVILDGCTDNTEEIVIKYKDDFAGFQCIKTANFGRASARNNGAKYATGKAVVFIDDDVELFDDVIGLHREFLAGDPSAVVFGSLSINRSKVADDDFQIYRWELETAGNSAVLGPITLRNFAFTTQNLSMARTAFDRIGGFMEGLNDSEDFDFGVRALLAGFRVRFEPSMRGFHNDYCSISRYIARRKEYFRSKLILLKVHPEYRGMLPEQFAWTNRLRGDRIKRVLFANDTWWLSFFGKSLFVVFPAPLRYRLYSMFIYVHTSLMVRDEMLLHGNKH